MGVVIGIDAGGTTTKISGFDRAGALLPPVFVRATDPITSVYGALGKFTEKNEIPLEEIDKISVTGVGASHLTRPIYGIDCEKLTEFPCIGEGGLYLSGLDEAIVVSMGTGTAIIHAKKGTEHEYLGGTGVGGGTVTGLCRKLIDVEDFDNIESLAAAGDLDKIDLRIKDLSAGGDMAGMRADLTAANFGRLSDLATKEDLALGVLNMVFETVGMMSIFAARCHDLKKIVLTGNLASLPSAKTRFEDLAEIFGVDFIIPEDARFGTVIGAAILSGGKK